MLLQLSVITHGSEGMAVPPASILGFTFDSDYRKYYLLLGVTIGMLILTRNLVRGRTGRAFLAIRENETAAEAMGVNLAQYKTIAFAIRPSPSRLAPCIRASRGR
jgi:branched-chain amino acid transport system permease protein